MKADIAHELIALGPWVASQHSQCSLIGGQAEDRIQRGGLACAVGTDEPEDPALLDAQIDAVERDGGAEGLAQAVCFYRKPWRQRPSFASFDEGAAVCGLQQFFR